MVRNFVDRSVRDGNPLGRGPYPYDPLDLVRIVGSCGDDEEAGKEIGRNAMRRDNVVGPSDGAHSPIRGQDYNGRDW